jgi:glycosyltransferase involved in cell wall biosynthesis
MLEAAILDLAAVLDGLVGAAFEILVVDDASEDETAALLEDLAARREHLPLRVVRHESRRGFAAALASGFEAARYELLFCLAVDGQFDVCELSRLVDLLDESTDLVVGYRDRQADGVRARLRGWAWNRLVQLLFGTTARDVECGFKLLRRDVWQAVGAQSRGPAFSAELLVKARRCGFRQREAPVRRLPATLVTRVPAPQQRAGEPSPFGRAAVDLLRLRRELDGLPFQTERPASSVRVGRRVA